VNARVGVSPRRIESPSTSTTTCALYDDVRARRIVGGVAEDEVALIHGAAKLRLFTDVNAGRVRILIGSTETMGMGTNVQRRLVALQHLDAPWRPRDIEQREGRILRQGNCNSEIELYRSVTEGSIDAYMWRTESAANPFLGCRMRVGVENGATKRQTLRGASPDRLTDCRRQPTYQWLTAPTGCDSALKFSRPWEASRRHLLAARRP
jgi:hypothetical protein